MTAEPRAAIDAVLERLLAAWQSGDAGAVASLFAPDGVYAASVGPGPGDRAQGRQAIYQLVERMFEVDAGAQSRIIGMAPTETGMFWNWEYTLPDGSVELGCDLIVIRNGLVDLKDAYRKVKS